MGYWTNGDMQYAADFSALLVPAAHPGAVRYRRMLLLFTNTAFIDKAIGTGFVSWDSSN